MNLRFKPVFLGGIIRTTQNESPALVPRKTIYMVKDLERMNKYFKVPLRLPSNFIEINGGIGSLRAMRFLTSIDNNSDGRLTEMVTREMFKRIFTNDPGLDITSKESFLEVGMKAGVKKDFLLDSIEMMESEKVKNSLRSNTDEAISHKAFGVPTIVAHTAKGPEMFFGNDRIELLAHVLGERYQGPVCERYLD